MRDRVADGHRLDRSGRGAAMSDASAEPVDRIVEIERLAALDPVEYEAVRVDETKRLNLRAQFLDHAVAKKRRELGLDNSRIDDGQGRAVNIPEVVPWLDPVDGDQIATMLAAAVKTNAVLSDHAADTITLWVLHTWVVNSFNISPRAAITSPTKGCGKTTVLRLLNKVARR